MSPAASRCRTKAGRGTVAAGRGFTLMELLVVVAIVAVASATVALAVRDPQAVQLEREAARLAMLLEAARAESRASGQAVAWAPGAPAREGQAPEAQGFHFHGLPPGLRLPQRWLDKDVQAQVVGAPALSLGPEPLIGPQRVVLRLDDRRLVLATDGLGPFEVLDSGAEVSTR